ncbi:MAG TPA: ATP-binding protein [Verrucomicrobiae bacterium]|nr:ATP-binding protein [Verrucomicrobiae bacterium]
MKPATIQPETPLSLERYKTTPEFIALHGISARAAAIRAAFIDDPKIRSLIWWLQFHSLQPGRLKKIATEVLEKNPHRIGTPSMRRFGMKRGQIYNAEQVKAVRAELPDSYDFGLRGETRNYMDDGWRSVDPIVEDGLRAVEESKKHPVSYPASRFVEICSGRENQLADFLSEFCINPRLQCGNSKADDTSRNHYEQKLEIAFGERVRSSRAWLWWFDNIVEALLEYKDHQEQSTRQKFLLTALGKKVWETLDYSLRTRRMVLLDGIQGRGKSEAAKAWVSFHPGEARYVELKGITNRASAFREIARALGVPTGYSKTASEIQFRIEDALQRSKLMLVVDEAHRAFLRNTRSTNRPELIDWFYSAVADEGVPLGLISTPQFIKDMAIAAEKTGWNYLQFRRRMKYVPLPAKNSESDIERVARHVLPGASDRVIDEVVFYVVASTRDLSAIGEIVDELKDMLGCDTLEKVTHGQVKRVIDERLMKSDDAFKQAIEAARNPNARKSNHRRRSNPEPILPADTEAENDEPATLRAAPIRAVEDLRVPVLIHG